MENKHTSILRRTSYGYLLHSYEISLNFQEHVTQSHFGDVTGFLLVGGRTIQKK